MKDNLLGPILLEAIIKKDITIINSMTALWGNTAPLTNFVNNIQAQGYEITDGPWDGNCFFRIIAAALHDRYPNNEYTHEALRQIAADHITAHPTDFEGFTFNRLGTPVTPAFYATQLRVDGIAADTPAIQALIETLLIEVNIHNADGTITTITPTNPTTPPIVIFDIGFTGGHYVQIDPTADEEANGNDDNNSASSSVVEGEAHIPTEEDVDPHHTQHEHEEVTGEYTSYQGIIIDAGLVSNHGHSHHGHHEEDVLLVANDGSANTHTTQSDVNQIMLDMRAEAAARYTNRNGGDTPIQHEQDISNVHICNPCQIVTTIVGVAVPILAIYLSYNSYDYGL